MAEDKVDVVNTEAVCVPGMAQIKTQYLQLDHVRQLNLDFIAREDKIKVQHENSTVISEEEPPRKKLKGQNKHRPREARIPKSEKLCLKLATENSCLFGDKCCFSHDIASYLAKKLPDINEHCYLFETFGRCLYSFTCRFGSQHLLNGSNVVNEELCEKMKNSLPTMNILSRDLQISLRKRTYNFNKTNNVLKLLKDGNFRKLKNEKECKASDVSQNKFYNECEIATSKNSIQLSTDLDKGSLHCQQSAVSNIKQEKSVDSSEIATSKNSIQLSTDLDKGSLHCQQSAVSNIKQEKSVDSSEMLNKGIDKPSGTVIDEDVICLQEAEIKKVDFRDKLYLAPLTTVGNLPFRRICKSLGADITCGEMALALNILQGQQSEWALLKRHPSEDIFGVQLCGAHSDIMTRCSQVLMEQASVDFIDVNMGCPIDFIYKKGAGCGLMGRLNKLEEIVYGMTSVIDVPLTLKMRTGIHENKTLAHTVISKIQQWKDHIGLITLHGRSREQRYTKSADWDYINRCTQLAHPIPLFGNGDILSYEDFNLHKEQTGISGVMIARGALIKPWIFKEIKEQQHWDISSSERFDLIRSFVNFGLEHWGSDTEGVEKTRRFLLEWLSFLYRYIPVGLLERLPQHINERPPPYYGRNDMETLMASPSCADWIKISEMLLGPVPENFVFLPKHKANAYT